MNNSSFDWTNIVLELSPRLLGYFAARFSRTQASDLTQETFLRLYLFVKQGHLDSSKGSLTMVAFGIARNVGLEFIRENIKHSHSVTEDLLQSFASNIESLNSAGNEETLALRQCILKLT
ncbi:MAG: hypothetical protein NT027_20295, partial [Proteobacteria bacterium]|nr:hypothetical protein [Pseudomonadota bacterium]